MGCAASSESSAKRKAMQAYRWDETRSECDWRSDDEDSVSSPNQEVSSSKKKNTSPVARNNHLTSDNECETLPPGAVFEIDSVTTVPELPAYHPPARTRNAWQQQRWKSNSDAMMSSLSSAEGGLSISSADNSWCHDSPPGGSPRGSPRGSVTSPRTRRQVSFVKKNPQTSNADAANTAMLNTPATPRSHQPTSLVIDAGSHRESMAKRVHMCFAPPPSPNSYEIQPIHSNTPPDVCLN